MKTVFINASPKKRLSASTYFSGVQSFFVRGNIVKDKLRNKADHERLLNTIKDADTVVFCLPLYIDGIPAHVLYFLQEMETFCKNNSLKLNVYVVSNCGFIEGNQNEAMMQVFENFCNRSNIKWCGGYGVGGGVMLNVLRIVFCVQVILLLIAFLKTGVIYGRWLPIEALKSLGKQTLEITFFNLGVFWYAFRMGGAINKGILFGKKYTRILLPSFVFIIFTDIFFFIISVFKGGIFRGWLSKK